MKIWWMWWIYSYTLPPLLRDKHNTCGETTRGGSCPLHPPRRRKANMRKCLNVVDVVRTNIHHTVLRQRFSARLRRHRRKRHGC